MMEGHTAIAVYIAVINLVAFVVHGWDKLCAKKHWWRVPELTLLAFATFGDSIGAMAAMWFFRHKTLHMKFKYGVPFILILQITGLVYLHLPR